MQITDQAFLYSFVCPGKKALPIAQIMKNRIPGFASCPKRYVEEEMG